MASKVLQNALWGPPVAGAIFGLIMSTPGSSASLTVSAGFATDSTGQRTIKIASALTKTISAWAAGNAGGLDTGAIAGLTWYHFYLIFNPTTGASDIVFSLNATTPTVLPSGYTLYRWIGAAKTTGPGNWIKFIQVGDYFEWDTPTQIVAALNNPGTAAVLRAADVPLGVRVKAHLAVTVQNSGTAAQLASMYVSDPQVADLAPTHTNRSIGIYAPTAAVYIVAGRAEAFTDLSQQVRTRMEYSDANIFIYMGTLGWTSDRGKAT